MASVKRGSNKKSEPGEVIPLPEPSFDNKISVERTLLGRRSVREYDRVPLSLSDVSQLLWTAQGVTGSGGVRTDLSAGALYPLEVYVVVGEVHDLSQGVYKYLPEEHHLVRIEGGDKRKALSAAALKQAWVREGVLTMVIAAVYGRMTRWYGRRGIRYVDMEVGHVTQSIHLQAVSLGLGTVVIGAFSEEKVKKTFPMGKDEEHLCMMPVGRITQLDKAT